MDNRLATMAAAVLLLVAMQDAASVSYSVRVIQSSDQPLLSFLGGVAGRRFGEYAQNSSPTATGNSAYQQVQSPT
jgi:hypothetical protein